jgi:hypothetical protein
VPVSSASTALAGDPAVAESSPGDLQSQTIVLEISNPSAFEFDTSAVVTANTRTDGGCTSTNGIQLNGNTSFPSTQTATVAADTISILITRTSTGCSDRITWSGIKVKAKTRDSTATIRNRLTIQGITPINAQTTFANLSTPTITGWTTYGAGCTGSAVDSFSGTTNTVCAKASTASPTTYKVRWYDGAGTQINLVNDGVSSSTLTGSGTGDVPLTSYTSSTSGTWHAMVYPNSETPPTTYTDDQTWVGNASFTVQASALPGLPTPLSAVLAALGAAGSYWAMRRKVMGG